MKTNNNRRSVGFPTVRLRRLRRSPAIRDILQETRLSVKDLICPIFIKEGIERPQIIESMPDTQRIPISKLIKNVEAITDLGIRELYRSLLTLFTNISEIILPLLQMYVYVSIPPMVTVE
jgi:porphobilinogen synthase